MVVCYSIGSLLCFITVFQLFLGLTLNQDCQPKLYNLTEYGGKIFNVTRTGPNCQENKCGKETAHLYCLNNGTCSSNKCHCPQDDTTGDFFTGGHCEIRKTHCTNAKDLPACKNAGNCTSVIKTEENKRGYVCSCLPGFSGTRCEINIDDCSSNPCSPNGQCRDLANDFECICDNGFTGKSCESEIDECSTNPCFRGRCINLINKKLDKNLTRTTISNRYECNCSGTGYEGENCEKLIDNCEKKPCKNDGECINEINNYKCNCKDGFNGFNCENDIDECLSNPCYNNATCQQKSSTLPPDQRAGFICSCIPGFTGEKCREDIDDCLNNKCSINSRCIDKVNSYHCDCDKGFSGTFCNHNIDECLSKPCQNGGTCRDGINDYTCLCPYPNKQNLYFGDKNCSTELIGCKQTTNPCGQGICLPSFRNGVDNAFDCQCNKESTGSTCKRSAVVSFDGKSAWRTEGRGKPTAISEFGVKVEFWFRTTVVDRTLFGAASSRSSMLSLLLKDSYSLVAKMNDITLSITSEEDIADGSENFVSLEIRPSYFVLQLVRNKKNLTNSINFSKRNIKMNDMTFGGIWECPSACFIGCMSGVYVYPERSTETVKAYIEAPENAQTCPRKFQCNENTCSKRGTCLDLWFDYKCVCERPYLGRNCEEKGLSLTFYNDTSVVYTMENFKDSNVDVSFFFRTRAENLELLSLQTSRSNLIFYINTTGFHLNDKALILKTVTDGHKHLVDIVISGGDLNVKLDDEIAKLEITESKITEISIKFEPKAKISFQDIRFNEKLLLLSNSLLLEKFGNNSLIPISSRGKINVGEVTANKCGQNVCNLTNTLECNNIFYDDYNCTCKKEWTGKQCDINDFCVQDPCKNISNTSCLNKPSAGGFYCIANVTLDKSVFFELESSIDSVKNTLFIEFRSRSPSNLFKMTNNRTELMLRINFDNIIINYEDAQCNFQTSLLDGEWREIKLEFSDQGVLYNREICKTIKGEKILNNLVHEYSLITIGEDYQGCIGKIFLGEELLSWIKNSPGIKSSYKLNDSSDIQLGCNPPDLCAALPCKNGECIDNFYRFNCSCFPGWMGNTCSQDINECNLGICENDGTCTNFDGGFSCMCIPGFSGTMCETDIDYCKKYSEENNGSLPCLNNGTCMDLQLGFNCTCPTMNITGNRCQYSPDSTCDTLDICRNGSTCQTTPDKFFKWECQCANGFEGRQCDQLIDYCLKANNPCQPNGQCENDRALYNYSCVCDPGFTSNHCDVDINECETNPCGKNGRCIDLINAFKCECSKGWNGTTCDQDVNECTQNPCKYNGTCVNTPGSYYCICQPAFQGDNCTEDFDECKNGICRNAVYCKNHFGSYECNCFAGWTGTNCENDYDDCINNPCQNKGKCIDGNNTYTCNCNGTGYEGQTCETDVDECLKPQACLNEGNCKNSQGNYSCICPSNFTGKKCEIFNLCAEENCNGNGNCTLNINKTVCNCYEGFEGEKCQSKKSDGPKIAIILGSVFGAFSLILFIAIITFIMIARKKRADRGVYSPSKEEVNGSRVDMNNVLKPPPEERLI